MKESGVVVKYIAEEGIANVEVPSLEVMLITSNDEGDAEKKGDEREIIGNDAHCWDGELSQFC